MPSNAIRTSLNAGPSSTQTAVSRKTLSEVEQTKAEVERLFLIVESLWILLKEKHGYTDEDLTQKIVDLDLSSGKLDNRRPVPEVGNCSKCQRRLMRNRKYCAYCGEIHIAGPFD